VSGNVYVGEGCLERDGGRQNLSYFSSSQAAPIPPAVKEVLDGG
jgi:hypothetical protein